MSVAIFEQHDQRPVLLKNISWQTYECLLNDYADSSSPRIAYNEGILEIMSPLPVHERGNRLIAQTVEILLEEWNIEYDNLGSTTFKNENTQKGVEPDTCFYIKNVAQIEGKERIDLAAGDPAPDLVIEMDVTSLSLDKMPILASFAVPEVWRAYNDTVTIYALQDDHYEAVLQSVSLPKLTATALNDLLSQSQALSRLKWIAAVREWARQNKPS